MLKIVSFIIEKKKKLDRIGIFFTYNFISIIYLFFIIFDGIDIT